VSLDDPHGLADGLDERRVVRRGCLLRARPVLACRVRTDEQVPGEPLRRLDGTQRRAVGRAGDELGSAGVERRRHELHGVGHRVAGDDGAVPGAHGRDDALHHAHGCEGAGGVVDEDDLVGGVARGLALESGDAGGHRGLAGRAAGDHLPRDGELGGPAEHVLERRDVVSGRRDDDPADLSGGSEPERRVSEERAPRQLDERLGVPKTQTAAGTGSRQDGDGGHASRHGVVRSSVIEVLRMRGPRRGSLRPSPLRCARRARAPRRGSGAHERACASRRPRGHDRRRGERGRGRPRPP